MLTIQKINDMKAEELRIGNIVWDDYSGEMIVSGILKQNGLKEELRLKKRNGLPEGSYICETIQPIPLTEEWLLKLGFVLNADKSFYWKNWGTNGVQILKYSDVYGKYTFELGKGINKVLDYVHELQNLYFALTGTELIIK